MIASSAVGDLQAQRMVKEATTSLNRDVDNMGLWVFGRIKVRTNKEWKIVHPNAAQKGLRL